MKYFKAIFSLLLLLTLISLLSIQLGKLPPLGNFVSPFTGFWQNAENTTQVKNESMHIPGLRAKVEIVYDEHMIPHIFAQNEHDLYLAQGYVTAKFRLWQMEIQTRSAGGRLTELVGEKALEADRYARRTGMVYGAENLLKRMKQYPAANELLLAYASGINAYISSLNNASLPFEYKLLNYKPEKWTPLQTGLLLKKMAENLTAMEHDIEYSNAKDVFGVDAVELIYRDYWGEQDPIIPVGTLFKINSQVASNTVLSMIDAAMAKENASSTKAPYTFLDEHTESDYMLGSNNWAVSGTKTKSGRPILCNDPHLKLSLPSIWFQIHLVCPEYNVCGASLPGAPGVISGFNDNIAWGVTNAGRDVRDWYQIVFKDSKQDEYLLDEHWMPVKKRIEKFVLKGGRVLYDTVCYTHQGPVVYDKNFNQNNRTNLALRWTAHDESEEMITFNKLNKAKNIADYFEAISHYSCPAQNFVFASKNGDIAIQQQGKFPIEQKDQAMYIQDGSSSKNDLLNFVPFADNPHMVNPIRGFVSSANQHPTDTTYPYPYGGVFEYFRNRRINEYLSKLKDASITDMEQLQQDNFNLFAKEVLPTMLDIIKGEKRNSEEEKIYLSLSKWNFYNHAGLIAPAYFEIWKDTFKSLLWDEMYQSKIPMRIPDNITTLHFINEHLNSNFNDVISTPKKETLIDVLSLSFKNACQKIEASNLTNWSNYKSTTIGYLLPNMPSFSRENVSTGGNKEIVNAISKYNGPSWRMIVEMTDQIHAEAIYPAGQSGNPGSKYYDDMISDWAAGKYYEVWHSSNIDEIKKHSTFTIQLEP